VLLILAGISIAMLTGENGILTKGESASKETEIVEAKEQAKLDIAKWIADKLEKGDSAKIDDKVIREILTGKEYVGSISTDKFTTKKNGYEIPYADLYHISTAEESAIPGVIVTGENKPYTKNGTAIIPVGFSIVEGLDDVSQGLVITDTLGNEFVWIPVTNESEYVRNKTYANINISPKAVDDTNYLPTGVVIPDGKTEAEVEKEMVGKAGGFYIGSYEAGKEGSNTLVCKKGATIWRNITQVAAKETAKTFINNEQVKSGIITGIQWDVTMAFVNGKLDGEGNIYNVKQYSNSRHGDNGLDITKAGQNVADRVCNIYGLEGSYYEYVAEKSIYNSHYPYIRRGGGYGTMDSLVASLREDDFNNNNSGGGNEYTTYRFVLYIMKEKI